MAKYNIYKVKSDKVDNLEQRLIDRGYKQITSTNQQGYRLTSYFTKTPLPTDIWWLEQFSSFFASDAAKKNTVYSGAILATKGDQAFLIALGKTHFYVQEYIDYTFGLKVAERIGSDKGAKTKSSKHFAGRTSKSMVSFVGDSALSFTPGEATDYVKLKAKDEETWGNSYIHFGTSVQFGSIKYEPTDLHKILKYLDDCLKEDASFDLPTILPVRDETRTLQLDTEVSSAVLDNSAQLSIVDFELYGVDFVFSQQTHIKLELDGLLSKYITELDSTAVKKFVEDNEIDLATELRNIKAKVFVNESSKFTVPLVNLLDYVGDGDHFLYRGKWYIFSKSFLDSLLKLIKTIPVSQMKMEFSAAEHKEWQEKHKNEEVNYRERYVIDKIIGSNSDLQDVDRSLDYKQHNGKKASIEVCDIYNQADSELNVVKIGEAKDFGYAFDQAALTLAFTEANQYKTEGGEVLSVKKLRLTLVSSNVAIPKSPAEMNSLSFQIKLGELANLARDKNVELIVTFARYSRQ